MSGPNRGWMRSWACSPTTFRCCASSRNARLDFGSSEGTYLAWLDCRGLGFGSADELRDFMRDRARVYFDEGVLFGENGAGFERVNLACPKALLKQVLDNIAVALSQRA